MYRLQGITMRTNICWKSVKACDSTVISFENVYNTDALNVFEFAQSRLQNLSISCISHRAVQSKSFSLKPMHMLALADYFAGDYSNPGCSQLFSQQITFRLSVGYVMSCNHSKTLSFCKFFAYCMVKTNNIWLFSAVPERSRSFLKVDFVMLQTLRKLNTILKNQNFGIFCFQKRNSCFPTVKILTSVILRPLLSN